MNTAFFMMIGMVLTAIILFVAKHRNTNNALTTPSPQAASAANGNQGGSATSTNNSRAKSWRSWLKIPLTLAGVILVIFLVSWIRSETKPETLGSGMTLFDGKTVCVRKHVGNDYSSLPKYDVMGNGVTRLETGGRDVYIIVWKRNEIEYVPSSQGPMLYDSRPLCRSTTETYSLFLGPKSRVKEVKVTARINQSERCDGLGGVVPVTI